MIWTIAFPIVVTIAMFAWAIPMRDWERPSGSMFDGLGYPMGLLMRSLGASTVSLGAWLLWTLAMWALP